MPDRPLQSCPEMMDYIQQVGFLPLLDSGIYGYSAEAVVDDDCRYVVNPDGGWDWPLWKWKGPIIENGNCVYGKFFAGKAGFVSLDWWPDFCNWRRSINPVPAEESIEESILMILGERGSMITRELRAACGFTGPKMRSRFDNYITRLQMACRIVTESFVYPVDRHNREYGWGWSLLTIPEDLLGHENCHTDHTPSESRQLILDHLRSILPQATGRQLDNLVG